MQPGKLEPNVYTITAKPNVSRIELAKWVYQLAWSGQTRQLPASLALADELIAGKELSMYLTIGEVSSGAALCNINEVPYVNPHADYLKEQEEFLAMRARGAAGDTASAIAYCQADEKRLVNHCGIA